ncbi:MAG: NAD(P)/FAD-dependent oxidoreductase [Moorea sp. SIO2B7]|nr:NAD(P)/FAD-dependent oxidoreductase [Moorena sp. SIO2B7]
MKNAKYKICILGGGFGGLYTALYLSRFARKSKNLEITLVEQKDHFLFTPLLYELVTGELKRWQIAPSYQKILANTNIRFCQGKIEDIDLENRQLKLKNARELAYDYLVLALGGKNRPCPIPGASEYALTFRSIADVESLEEKLRIMELSERQHLQLGVIGGGPNGVELACKLADRLGKRGQVHLIEKGREILKNFSPSVRSAAYRALKVRGVKINFETNIKEIQADKMTLVHDNQLTKVPVDLVLWTAGTQSLEWMIKIARCNSQGKLLTRPTLQLVDYPEVFALGDAADIRNSNKPVPATAQAAFQQASFAARNIMGIIRGKRLQQFRYFHLGDMLTLGKGSAIVSSFFLNIEGNLGEIIRRLAYIQRMPTFRHRLQVFKHLFIRFFVKKRRFGKLQRLGIGE